MNDLTRIDRATFAELQNAAGEDFVAESVDTLAKWLAGRMPRAVAMTADAMQGDREACLTVGIEDCVTKPIRVDERVAALGRIEPRQGSWSR